MVPTEKLPLCLLQTPHSTSRSRTDHGAQPPRTPSVPPSSKKKIDQLPAYAALGTTPPPTPPSQHVNPYQNSPPLTDAGAEVPPEDLDEHQRAIRALHQRAIAQQAANPVSFALTNEWNDTITSDKKHHLEHFLRGTT